MDLVQTYLDRRCHRLLSMNLSVDNLNLSMCAFRAIVAFVVEHFAKALGHKGLMLYNCDFVSAPY